MTKLIFYQDPNGEYCLTEKEVLDGYYSYWSGKMLEVHKSPMITERNCINDYMIVHWAFSTESKVNAK